jgi:hypothetical protein
MEAAVAFVVTRGAARVARDSLCEQIKQATCGTLFCSGWVTLTGAASGQQHNEPGGDHYASLVQYFIAFCRAQVEAVKEVVGVDAAVRPYRQVLGEVS